jgi:hypothetical protein
MNLLSGTPKFLVSRERWRGSKTYHVCSCTPDDVIGILKSDPVVCPFCGREDLEDIFTAMDRRLRFIPVFLESLRVKDGPYGRYRESRFDPLPYRMICSDQAMSMGHQVVWSGYDPIWTREQLEAWQKTILMDLNPETGLIEDPFDLAEHGRTDAALYRQYMLSRYFVEEFRRNGFPGYFKIPDRVLEVRDPFTDAGAAMAFLEDRTVGANPIHACTWRKDPYSKGSQVVRGLQAHAMRTESAGQPDDGVAELVHRWLDQHQNPDTGYWGGEEASLNNGSCGAFKIVVAYLEHDWSLPRPEKMIDTTLALADKAGGFGCDDRGLPSFGCHQFDPLMLLKNALDQRPEYRLEGVMEATARSYLNFARHWSDEEHFFVHPSRTYPTLTDMHAFATVMYMAEILLGVEILRKDR